MSGLITEHMAECCMCLAAIDTREEAEGGDPYGAEMTGGRWVCSPECWDAARRSAVSQGHENVTRTVFTHNFFSQSESSAAFVVSNPADSHCDVLNVGRQPHTPAAIPRACQCHGCGHWGFGACEYCGNHR